MINKDNSPIKSAMTLSRWFMIKMHSYPITDHLLRAVARFSDRLGSQFGAAITYFSFLSIIPVLMLAFAAAGFLLASRPELLQELMDKIVHVINEPNLALMLEKTVNTAVQQRKVVGISGFLMALYSGISWMGNLREAIRAQSRDVWERNPEEKENIFKHYAKDFVSLIGLGFALVLTIVLTFIAGAAQKWIVDTLGLESVEWLSPLLTIVALSISVGASYLMFLWIYWMLPSEKPQKSALLKGTLIAAIGFEVIKFAMTKLVPLLIKSPSGAAFGSIIALLAFFYFFARLTLFCAAWIATAKTENDD